MLVLEYKIKAKLNQYKAIDEAIRTVQFIRNKCIRYWMDAPRDTTINRFALNKYSTELRSEFKFVKDLNSITGKEIGLDVGLESFYTDSNGHHEPNPKFLRTADSDIKHAQRLIYKKNKGSNNRRKARKRYSKKHLRVSRQRKEHASRLARCVVKSNDLVAYEDLRIKNMVRCHNLAKSIADASWYQFRLWIEHFSKKFGKTAIAVPPHNTSQECCICGKKVKKELRIRVHSCTCGLTIHRDINAAINILLRAKSRDGQSQSNACLSRSLYASWSNPARASGDDD